PQEMSLRAAARLLAQGRVTGAPVIDGQGRLVGVLSATDFVHWVENDEFAPIQRRVHAECMCSDWQVADAGLLPADQVSVHMTRDVVTVPPTAGIEDLARRMLDAHIHRLIVVDAENRPVGIISTTDMLAAVAYADKARAMGATQPESVRERERLVPAGRW